MRKSDKEFVDRLLKSLEEDPIAKYGEHIVGSLGDPEFEVIFLRERGWKPRVKEVTRSR